MMEAIQQYERAQAIGRRKALEAKDAEIASLRNKIDEEFQRGRQESWDQAQATIDGLRAELDVVRGLSTPVKQMENPGITPRLRRYQRRATRGTPLWNIS